MTQNNEPHTILCAVAYAGRWDSTVDGIALVVLNTKIQCEGQGLEMTLRLILKSKVTSIPAKQCPCVL